MSEQRNREEAVNTQLALLISKLGVTADAETIHAHGKHRPDVLFQLRGLRVVIESKFKDTPNAEQVVLDDARKRVRAGVAHIAAATVYPDELRTARTTKLFDTLEDARLRYRIVTETFESESWFEGNPASLMEALRRAQESLAQDDIVEKTAEGLSTHLESIAKLWIGQTGACDRLSKLLGLVIPKEEQPQPASERREAAAKVSALVLANAFIFQEQLALSDERVDTLRKLKKSSDLIEATSEHWCWIWENINYATIFQLGERIFAELPASASTTEIVKSLLDAAHKICAEQAALRHDLMGRIYHRLLPHAKYLGTYYTSVSAADAAAEGHPQSQMAERFRRRPENWRTSRLRISRAALEPCSWPPHRPSPIVLSRPEPRVTGASRRKTCRCFTAPSCRMSSTATTSCRQLCTSQHQHSRSSPRRSHSGK